MKQGLEFVPATKENSEKALQALDTRFEGISSEHVLSYTIYNALRRYVASAKTLPAFFIADESPATTLNAVFLQQQVATLPKHSFEEYATLLTKIPAMPSVLQELQAVFMDPLSCADDIAKLISRDPSLTKTVLQQVNSAYYRRLVPVEMVSQAVTVLGLAELKNLFPLQVLSNLLGSLRTRFFKLESFWLHSCLLALLGQSLWTQKKMPNAERLFLIGQLHEVGRIALCCIIPERMDLSFQLAQAQGTPLSFTEKEILGFYHTEMCIELLKRWNMPMHYVCAIEEQYPHIIPQSNEAQCLQVAHYLAHAMNNNIHPIIHLSAFPKTNHTNFNFTEDEIIAVVDQALALLPTYATFF